MDHRCSRLSRVLVTGLAVVLLGSAEAPAQPQPSPSAPVPLRLGLGTAPPVMNSHYFYYAQAAGFYRDAGLALEIVPFNGDQTVARALTTGEVDVAWAGCNSPIQAIDSGLPFVLISAFEPKLDFILVGKKDVGRARDLEGRSLGVSQPGAVSHQVPVLMIQADGGDPRKATVVAIGGTAARVQALAAGKIDAAMLDRAALIRAAADPTLRVVANAPDLLPDYLFGCEYATRAAVERRPAVLQAFVTATARAVRWFYRNHEEAVAVTQKVLPDTPRATIDTVLRHYAQVRLYSVSGTVRREAFDFTLRVGKDAGDIKGSPEYERAVTVRFTEAASAALGPFTP